jgi:hypothetical protein
VSTSADPAKLVEFIGSAKSHGAGDQFLVALLRQHGWSERRIFAAFSTYYEGATGLTIPSRGTRTENARDAFLYLLAFVTLGISTVAFVWLAYILIDHAFPSPLDYAYSAGASFREGVAGQLASLIVAFPIFILVSRAIVRETRQRPESLDSGVRKWLTYIALVLTSLALLGDGVWFLQQFLLGDLTLRFVVKAVTLFAVAGAILWYYLGTVRAAATPASRDSIFGWVAAAAVAIAVVLGFTGVGTPRWERSMQLDATRVSNLQSIESSINSDYRKDKVLPKALPGDSDSRLDPVTKSRYGYVPLGGSRYRLCATFDAADSGEPNQEFWKHSAGETCFTLDATKDEQ